MSIWISDFKQIGPVAGCLALTVLTSCGGIGVGRFNASSNTNAVGAQKTTIEVSSKSLTVQGPPGFCVDDNVTEVQADNAFVLLGDCAIVAPRIRAPDPGVRALLTASISGSGQGAARISDATEGMDGFFRSENGRTALSRSSDPGTVEVLETFQNDEAFFLRASDSSEGLVPGASDDYWRAYFDMNDQIVSVSVIGFKEEPLAPDTSLETLREFANAMKINNGMDVAPFVAEEAPPTQTQTATATPRRKPNVAGTLMTVGLLRRLFNSF